MRIINRIEFLKQPNNTLFSTYEPQFFGELQIKGDTIGLNDFRVQPIHEAIKSSSSEEFTIILGSAQSTGESFDMDFDCWSRDGFYDPDTQLYAIWEKKDVQALIARLTETI